MNKSHAPVKKTLKNISVLLLKTNRTISIAESCTGGLVSNLLTDIPGSSNFFKLSIIPYSNKFKTRLLKVSKNILRNKGAASKEAAIIMSQNIRKLAKTSFGLGITGIAGPTGATKTKPVGLVYIAIANDKKTTCKKFLFKGNRGDIKKQTASAALALLLNNL